MKKIFFIKVLLIFNSIFVILRGGTDGTIRGKIADKDGAGLSGASVFLPKLDIGGIADLEGNYIILNVPVGSHTVVVQMIGYQKQIMRDVQVKMDQTVWLNFILTISAIEGDEVEVLGQRALVEKGTTGKKITVEKEAIEALPIRDVSDLYSLQSGVVKVEGHMQGKIADHEERGLEEVHVRGGRSGEIAYMIDGLYIRNPIFGGIGSGTRLNKFAIKEFDWQPGGFNAEYGDAMSAVSNWHTNSGTTELSYKFEHATGQLGASAGNEYDRLRGYEDYNLGLGGTFPGMLDNLSFWVSGQFTNYKSYSVYKFDDIIYVDDPADPYNVTNRGNLVQPWDNIAGFRGFGFNKTWDIFGKLLYKFSNKLRLNLSYWQVENHRKSFNPKFLYWDKGQNELFRDTYRYGAEINHSLSSKTFYTVRVSRFIQDQFQGVRWQDSDEDGYPDWFEWRHPAGANRAISDPNNPLIVPYTVSDNGDTILYVMKDDNSGWYYDQTPGLYNWESAEEFTDVNGNGIWDPGEQWIDKEGDHYTDGSWDGPELVEELYYRDGSHWLAPEMYINKPGLYYDDFNDFRSVDIAWGQDPFRELFGRAVGPRYSGYSWDPNYYMPTFDGYSWNEGRAFGGHDRFYSDSRAVTDEIKVDFTSQLTNKWKLRTGVDLKTHKLNFYEVRNPWLGLAAPMQTFAEYWEDTGPDGLVSTDGEYEVADFGENNGQWDVGEEFTDANGNGSWDDFREPFEIGAYFQNTFEVPWMVINAGIRADFVNYNTQIWSDTSGNYSPGRPWYYEDQNDNNVWDSETEEAGDHAGFANQKTFLKDSKWFYKISPRIGFSHVITDKSTFTFNYGLYYQTPIYANVYLNTNRLEDPEELFEEGEGYIGNATMSASRTQSYSCAYNVQVGRNWSYKVGMWIKDMDQWSTLTYERSGVYNYRVHSNGDYGGAKGIDITLTTRGLAVNSELQYTYSIAKGNSEYDWANAEGIYVDAPSQEYRMPYDRPHDLTLFLYTDDKRTPFGIRAGITAFYQSGFPYTPLIEDGDKNMKEDVKNKYSKRSPAYRNVNLSLSKFVKYNNFRVSLGLQVFNVLDLKNASGVYPITGQPDDPGNFYLDRVGLPDINHDKSNSYYDTPWYLFSAREVNVFIKIEFN
jgi:hypothetical protein